MPIQWFPGHMHTTRKAIAERLPDTDVVIELLDARLPGSSSNPLLAQMIDGKPTLKLLTKDDLADPERTALWLAHFQARDQTGALALHAGQAGAVKPLVAACRALAPGRGGMVKPLRVMVCGIPNVGKSTLINALAGRRKAKTGDEPGITKNEQKIVLAQDVYLWDTAGMLWPKIVAEQAGYHLAAGGSVGRNAYDETEVALALLAQVRGPYAPLLAARYKLTEMDAASDEDLLTELGKRRGGLLPGGQVNLHKAAEICLNDFRSGAWGRITLETPDEFAAWLAAGQAEDEQRQAERKQKREQRKRQVPQRGAEPAEDE